MTDTEVLELKFYKNGSANNVLKRFNFSEEETQLIKDAIRTANMHKPRMQLIHKADELLKEVVKTREPIKQANKTKVSAENMAKFELVKLSKEKKEESSGISMFGFKSKYGIATVILMAVGVIAMQYFLVKPINDKAQMHQDMIYNQAQKQQDLLLGKR